MNGYNRSELDIKPVTLEGKRAKLIPLEESHIEALYEAGRDNKIWEHYTFRKLDSLNEFRKFMLDTIEASKTGRLAFTLIDKESGKFCGSTSFYDLSHENRAIEIGRTWLTPQLWGTGFNEECKLLLLTHCFEDLKTIRVFFKTDSNNLRSQKAIQKIGAKYEGILRNHMIREDGTYRHSVYFSIIESEWPDIKKHLKDIVK